LSIFCFTSILKAQDGFINKFENLQDKKIIAVGESVHAINDFANWNINFFKELVLNDITKIFMLENDFSNSKQINRYISGELENTDIDNLMKKNLYGVWRSYAMREFLEWSRKYNAEISKKDKIKFFGFDSQCGSCAMKEILKFINNNRPDLKTKLSNEGLKLLSEINLSKNYNLKKLTKEEQDLMEQTLEKMNQLFEKEIDLDKTIHTDLLALNHAWEFENANPLNFTNIRDRNMAIIFKEIIKNETKPVLMWAHNGHINKSKTLFYKPLGYHLYENFGPNYLAIGLDFKEKEGSNKFSPIDKSNWIANKINYEANKNIYVLETKNIGRLAIRNYGTSSGRMKLKNNNQFDYIVYFKKIKN
jgi:erythromycin esterase-like protein